MAQYYPDEFLQEVGANNDIIDIVSNYVHLKRRGKYMMGLCPFHKEKTPSFAVSPDKQLYYCFGCGAGGDVINFIMRIENLDFIDSVKFLAEHAGMQIPQNHSENGYGQHDIKQDIYKIHKISARFFYDNLNNKKNKAAIEYLYNRKLNAHTINSFGLGFANNSWNDLYDFLVKEGFDRDTILKSGLVLPKDNGNQYDRFRNRIMFPIIDVRGNIIGFGGRVLDNSLPKYLNSPETLIFNKRRNLYALNFAKDSNEDSLIMVEGYMDAITLHQHGITNVVASLGTALSEEQAKLIKRYCNEVIICYDSDTAGQAATLRSLDILYTNGCNVKVMSLDDAKDPDEYIRKKGVDRFKIKLKDKCKSLLEYKVDLLRVKWDISNIEEKVKFVNAASNELAKIENNIEREAYVRKISRETDISAESIFSEITKIMYKNSKKYENKKIRTNIKPNNIVQKNNNNNNIVSNIENAESMLLTLLCYDVYAYKKISSIFRPEDYSTDIHKKLAEIIYELMENNKKVNPVYILSKFDEDSIEKVTYILHKELNFEDNLKAVDELIERINIERKKNHIAELLKTGNINAVNSMLKELKNKE